MTTATPASTPSSDGVLSTVAAATTTSNTGVTATEPPAMVWVVQGKTDHAAFLLQTAADGRKLVKWANNLDIEWLDADVEIKVELPKRRRGRKSEGTMDEKFVFSSKNNNNNKNNDKKPNVKAAAAAAKKRSASLGDPKKAPAAAANLDAKEPKTKPALVAATATAKVVVAKGKKSGQAKNKNSSTKNKQSSKDVSSVSGGTRVVVDTKSSKTAKKRARPSIIQQEKPKQKSKATTSKQPRMYPKGTKVCKNLPMFGSFIGQVDAFLKGEGIRYRVVYDDENMKYDTITEEQLTAIVMSPAGNSSANSYTVAVSQQQESNFSKPSSSLVEQTTGEASSSSLDAVVVAAGTGSRQQQQQRPSTSAMMSHTAQIRPKEKVLPRRPSQSATATTTTGSVADNAHQQKKPVAQFRPKEKVLPRRPSQSSVVVAAVNSKEGQKPQAQISPKETILPRKPGTSSNNTSTNDGPALVAVSVNAPQTVEAEARPNMETDLQSKEPAKSATSISYTESNENNGPIPRQRFENQEIAVNAKVPVLEIFDNKLPEKNIIQNSDTPATTPASIVEISSEKQDEHSPSPTTVTATTAISTSITTLRKHLTLPVPPKTKTNSNTNSYAKQAIGNLVTAVRTKATIPEIENNNNNNTTSTIKVAENNVQNSNAKTKLAPEATGYPRPTTSTTNTTATIPDNPFQCKRTLSTTYTSKANTASSKNNDPKQAIVISVHTKTPMPSNHIFKLADENAKKVNITATESTSKTDVPTTITTIVRTPDVSLGKRIHSLSDESHYSNKKQKTTEPSLPAISKLKDSTGEARKSKDGSAPVQVTLSSTHTKQQMYKKNRVDQLETAPPIAKVSDVSQVPVTTATKVALSALNPELKQQIFRLEGLTITTSDSSNTVAVAPPKAKTTCSRTELLKLASSQVEPTINVTLPAALSSGIVKSPPSKSPCTPLELSPPVSSLALPTRTMASPALLSSTAIVKASPVKASCSPTELSTPASSLAVPTGLKASPALLSADAVVKAPPTKTSCLPTELSVPASSLAVPTSTKASPALLSSDAVVKAPPAKTLCSPTELSVPVSSLAAPTGTKASPAFLSSDAVVKTPPAKTLCSPTELSVPASSLAAPTSTKASPAFLSSDAVVKAPPAKTLCSPTDLSVPVSSLVVPISTMASPALLSSDAEVKAPSTKTSCFSTELSAPASSLVSPTSTVASPALLSYDAVVKAPLAKTLCLQISMPAINQDEPAGTVVPPAVLVTDVMATPSKLDSETAVLKKEEQEQDKTEDLPKAPSLPEEPSTIHKSVLKTRATLQGNARMVAELPAFGNTVKEGVPLKTSTDAVCMEPGEPASQKEPAAVVATPPLQEDKPTLSPQPQTKLTTSSLQMTAAVSQVVPNKTVEGEAEDVVLPPVKFSPDAVCILANNSRMEGKEHKSEKPDTSPLIRTVAQNIVLPASIEFPLEMEESTPQQHSENKENNTCIESGKADNDKRSNNICHNQQTAKCVSKATSLNNSEYTCSEERVEEKQNDGEADSLISRESSEPSLVSLVAMSFPQHQLAKEPVEINGARLPPITTRVNCGESTEDSTEKPPSQENHKNGEPYKQSNASDPSNVNEKAPPNGNQATSEMLESPIAELERTDVSIALAEPPSKRELSVGTIGTPGTDGEAVAPQESAIQQTNCEVEADSSLPSSSSDIAEAVAVAVAEKNEKKRPAPEEPIGESDPRKWPRAERHERPKDDTTKTTTSSVAVKDGQCEVIDVANESGGLNEKETVAIVENVEHPSSKEEAAPEDMSVLMDLAGIMVSMQSSSANVKGSECENKDRAGASATSQAQQQAPSEGTSCPACGVHIAGLAEFPVDWTRPLHYPHDADAIQTINDHVARHHNNVPLWNTLEATICRQLASAPPKTIITPKAYVRLGLRHAMCCSYGIDESLLDMSKLRDLFVRRLGIARGFIEWSSDYFIEGRTLHSCSGEVVDNNGLRKSALLLLAYLEEYVIKQAFVNKYQKTEHLAHSLPLHEWRNLVQLVFLEPSGFEKAWFMDEKEALPTGNIYL